MSVEVMSMRNDNLLPSAMEVEEIPAYVSDLHSENLQTIQEAISTLKNNIIGSNRRKALALRYGVLPQILSLLGDNRMTPEIRRDSCVILGSFVKGTTDNVLSVVNACSVPKLLSVLASSDSKLVEYSLNCLTTIFSHSFAPVEILYAEKNIIPHLLTLMNQSVENQISVSTILSHVCQTEEQQGALCKNGVITPLALLMSSPCLKVQMPAINFLSAMAYKNERVSRIIVSTRLGDKTVPDILLRLIARDSPHQMQLAVARCFTFLHRADALSATDPRICMKTLSCLVRMCDKEYDPESRTMAAETLSYLIEVDKDLQLTAAISNHLIPTLADYLKYQTTPYKPLIAYSPGMTQAAFKAFASLGANDESIRKRIIESDHLMDRVVAGLDDSNETVALAAVRCLHSLSRSVHLLRTTFKDHAIWRPLLKLLQHPSLDILNVASSTLCNLLLEFSPSKEPILEAGAVEILSALTKHDDLPLRLNGIWALMNVAFQTDQKVKSQIFEAIGTQNLIDLLSDPEERIVMKTLGLLRNLVATPHIDSVMELYGRQVIEASLVTLNGDNTLEIKEQVLCMLANIADGIKSKVYIMENEDMLKKITYYLTEPIPKLQVAAVLCVSNLAWKEEEGSDERQAKLKDLGIPKLLHQMITASDQGLFDRVKTALQQFSQN